MYFVVKVQGHGNSCHRAQISSGSFWLQRMMEVYFRMSGFNGLKWPQRRMMRIMLVSHKSIIMRKGSFPRLGNKIS